LGLTRTYQGGPINEKNNEVKSFNLLSNRWEDATESDMFVPGGAGAIASTPSDLLTFFHALMNEQLINRTSLDQMMQTTDGFGLGVLTFPFYDKTAFGHNGGIDAFVSNAAYFPSDNVAISIVSNGLNVALNDVLIGILSCTFNKPFDIPSFEFLALSDAESTRCPATYVSSDLPLEIRIFVENGQLYAQATGQSAFTLEKTKDGAFEYKAANIKITFNWSEDGAVSGFVLNQHGQKYSYNPK
jgi:CubicO group peptidase (beta-lactamase class C family)